MLVDVLRVISTLGLVVVMFSLGLKIKFIEIKKIFTKFKNLIIGLVCQIILIPIIGMVFILTFDFSTNILVAIMIVACMPSAATSNYICSKINGDLSLSMSKALTPSSNSPYVAQRQAMINSILKHSVSDNDSARLSC